MNNIATPKQNDPPIAVSFATNACAMDENRIAIVVPHWLRTFGKTVGEILIVVDERATTGRLAVAGKPSTPDLGKLFEALHILERSDSRVRWLKLEEGVDATAIHRQWFRFGHPNRCQAGTPIFAFVRAIEAATNDFIVKLDCDMLFSSRAWLTAGIERISSGAASLIEPARCGIPPSSARQFSTRAFLLRRSVFARDYLPIRPHTLDPARCAHRLLLGRPVWLALEQMLEKEVRAGRIRFESLDPTLGSSLHVWHRKFFSSPTITAVVDAVERGTIPAHQFNAGPDFQEEAWGFS